MIRHIIFIAFFFGTLISCMQSEKTASNNTVGDITLIPLDTIPLFDEVHTFQFHFFRNLEINKVSAFNYPILDLSVIDLESGEVRQITQAGEAPGELANIAEPIIAPNGDLYVLEQYNVTRLHIFNEAYEYKHTIRFDELNTRYFPELANTHFQVFKYGPNEHKLVFSVEDLLNSQYNPKSYDAYGLVEFILNIEDYTISKPQYFLTQDKVPAIKKALSANELKWQVMTPNFTRGADHYYVMYQTSKLAFKYDTLWNLVETYPVSYQYPAYGYAVPFKEIDDTKKRLFVERKLQYTNHTITHTGFVNNHFLFTYRKPIREEQIPESGVFDREFVLHAINVDDGREFDLLVPPNLVGFKFQALPGGRLAITGRVNEESEDRSLFIFKVEFG